ncbi:44733_t:CDS:1, partial [Gigaspora margarita]
MGSNEPKKSSEEFNFSENSHDSLSDDLTLAIGPHGLFFNHGSSANCFCDQCSGRCIPLYTCRGESCKIKCPPHVRKCSKCAGHNYSARHKINRKYYANLKSRINSENSISFGKSLINKSENSISSEQSLINKSSDSVIDKDLPEIWNNFWSEFLESLS